MSNDKTPFYIDLSSEDINQAKQAESLAEAQAPASKASSISITKLGVEIGHANEVLKKAKALVDEAWQLICKDEVAREHLEFSATVSWSSKTWNKLNDAYAEQNPDSKDTYHWRAFSYFGLEVGSSINGES